MTKLSKTIILVFSCAVIIVSVALFIITPKKDISFNENRYLQKPPEVSWQALFSGELMEDIELYINDHFPFRDNIVGIKSVCEKAIGKTSQNSIYLGENEYLIKEYKEYEEKMMNNHCDRISSFADSTEAKVYFILAPTSNLVYSEYKPKFASDMNQSEDINSFYNKLNGICTINITEILFEQKQNYPLYFRLDHHWNSYGAYYAYSEFCCAADIVPIDINDFDVVTVTDDFNGTYYSKSTYYEYTPDTIDVLQPKDTPTLLYENLINETSCDSLYFEEYLSTKDKYSYFLDGNQPLIKVTNSSVANDKSIAVVKDSYANIFIPYLANHYSKIYVIDMRYFSETLSEYVNENDIQEVLFLYNIETIKNDLGILKIK